MFRRKRSTSTAALTTPHVGSTTTTGTQLQLLATTNNTGNTASSSSSSTTTTTTTATTVLLSYITPSKIIIVLLLYIIFMQYSIIRIKDAAILTILTHPSSPSSLSVVSQHHHLSSSSSSSRTHHLFNHQQQQLLEAFRNRNDATAAATTTSIRRVGVFPIRPPRPRNATTTTRTPTVAWQPHTSTRLSKISYPIFVPSLPKSGTTSIWKYFKCGQQSACHNWIQKIGPHEKSTLLGKCIETNILQSAPPFENCGPYDVYTDTGYLNYDHDIGERCFYPSIDGLDAIYESYPTITFVNVVRNTEAWYHSIRTWSAASLFVRLRLCNATGFPDGQSTKEEIMQMYDNFNNMIRQFVKDRPSITYIEVQLESNSTGQLLQEATGIDSACWKVCRPQDRHCQGDEPKHHHHHQRQHPKPPNQSDHGEAVQSIKETAMGASEGDGDDSEGEGGEDTDDEGEEGNDDDEGIPS